MDRLTRSHEEATIESFRKNKELAMVYLNAVLVDGDPEECLQALRRVVEAECGFAGLARATKLNEKSLHRALSRDGNPTFKSLLAVLRALGVNLSVQTTKQEESNGSRMDGHPDNMHRRISLCRLSRQEGQT